MKNTRKEIKDTFMNFNKNASLALQELVAATDAGIFECYKIVNKATNTQIICTSIDDTLCALRFFNK